MALASFPTSGAQMSLDQFSDTRPAPRCSRWWRSVLQSGRSCRGCRLGRWLSSPAGPGRRPGRDIDPAGAREYVCHLQPPTEDITLISRMQGAAGNDMLRELNFAVQRIHGVEVIGEAACFSLLPRSSGRAGALPDRTVEEVSIEAVLQPEQHLS